MFKIYHEFYDSVAGQRVNTKIYDDTSDADNLKMVSAVLSTEAGTAGTFEMDVPISNIAFGTFAKFASRIRVYRGTALIFSGRVYSEELDYYGNSHIVCEGMLAVLNDTIFRPELYNGSLQALVRQIITAHNTQVDATKQITVGTLPFPTQNVDRQYENYESTFSRLADLVDTFGGYLEVVDTASGLTLNWIEEFTDRSNQAVTFAGNLLDLKQESNANEIATVIIPLGAEVDNEDGTRGWVTIEGLPGVTGDYIENEDAIAEFGRITKVVQFNDITVPTNLYDKAVEYLTDISRSKVSIEVSAIDMAGATITGGDGTTGGAALAYWKVGDVIHVNAPEFGVDDWFTCLEQELDLMDATNNELTLSTKFAGYVGSKNLGRTIINRLEEFSLNAQNAITNSANAVRNELNEEISDTNAALGDLTSRVETAETWIGSSEDTIAAGAIRAVEEEYSLAGTLEQIQSQAIFSIDPEKIQESITNSDQIESWMAFTENGLEIGKSDSEIYSEQDNDSYSFRSRSSGEVLLEINPDGIVSDTVSVDSQIKMTNGGVDQWAIRNGAASTTGSNFDIVWIG